MMILIVMLKNWLFIAYFNKMMANYSSLQPTVLINLFKSYCCSFYGSPLWKLNSTGFENVVKLGILQFVNCCIYHLKHIPTWILCPLIGQRHISTVFIRL